LSTAFLTAREAIRIFLRLGSGSLTLTSSVLATSPSPEFFKTHAYATAKSGINGLVTTLSAAYVQQGIRVNAVAPGLVATPMAARAKDNPEIVEFTKKKQPFVGNQLSVDAIVSAYLYLLENKFVTGQVITVDGGWTSVTNV
jgi:NAD(P)-dependent dehydrogenase (short-subunit alcohol dehydrogenase family)